MLSEEVEAGDVAAVEPGEQTRVSLEDEIVLQISRGGYYVVENYVGMTLSQLQQTFAENGVNIRIRQMRSPVPMSPRETILSQSLSVGEKIDPQGGDNEIEITVATSPTFTIPSSIIGMELQQAKDLLNSYGAAVVTSRISEDILNEEEKLGAGLVVRTDPSPQESYTQEGTDRYIVLYIIR